MIPMRPRFTVGQDRETVGEADDTEVVDTIVYDGSQTDCAVAGRSETHQIGLTVHFPLGNMMVCHLPRDQGAGRSVLGEEN